MILLSGLKRNLNRLLLDRRAAIAPTFALLLLPLLGMMGFAVDVSSMLAARTRAQNIADAGALELIRYTKEYMDANGNTTAVFNKIQPTAQTAATTMMNAMLAKEGEVYAATAYTGLNNSNNTLTAGTNITFNYKTVFMGLFGIDTVALNTESFTSATLAKFIQVIFVADVSESMGVGATDTDVTNMQNDAQMTVGAGGVCGFACHTNSSTGDGSGETDNRALAKTKGYKLKIDSVQSAVQDFTTKMNSANTAAPGHYYAGIYTFSNVLHTVLTPTTNFTAITAALPSIDLDLGSGKTWGGCWNSCQGWTNLTGSLASVKNILTNVGDGSSATSMLTYVIILTDGVEDVYNTSAIAMHQTDATWSGQCSAIKATGATIATVQAVYTPLTVNNGAFTALVSPIASQIPTAFSTCASSSSLTLTATDGPGIETAVQNLFTQIVASPRLTN